MTRWAIDANIFMQQATRRLVCGTIEYRRDELLIPERALLLARLVYDDLALKRAQRITEHDERHGITPGTGAYNALVARRASAILENFAAWTGPKRSHPATTAPGRWRTTRRRPSRPRRHCVLPG